MNHFIMETNRLHGLSHLVVVFLFCFLLFLIWPLPLRVSIWWNIDCMTDHSQKSSRMAGFGSAEHRTRRQRYDCISAPQYLCYLG